MRKSFAQERAERIQWLRANTDFSLKVDSPVVRLPVRARPFKPGPAPRPTAPVELHTVARSVLVFAHTALVSGTAAQRALAARTLAEELASGISRGGR